MTEIASPSQRTRFFYRAALLGLVALDATESAPRRFGSAPDARWAVGRGRLGAPAAPRQSRVRRGH